MEKEQLKRIFDFLEEKGEHNAPVKWKLINNIPLKEEDLNVKGDLDLSKSNITLLPEGLKVGGNLSLFKCVKLTSLPEGLQVVGLLDLSFSRVELLPEDLKVGGTLHIENTPLKKYTNKELRGMIKSGFIKGKIYRT